eukprot:758077-Hanusia_phi.AAC.1
MERGKSELSSIRQTTLDIPRNADVHQVTTAIHLGDIVDVHCPRNHSIAAFKAVVSEFKVLVPELVSDRLLPAPGKLVDHCFYYSITAVPPSLVEMMKSLTRSGYSARVSGCTNVDLGHHHLAREFRKAQAGAFTEAVEKSVYVETSNQAKYLLHKHHGRQQSNLLSPSKLEGLNKRFVAFNGALSSKQLKWMEGAGSNPCADLTRQVFIFSHNPLHPDGTAPQCLLWNYDVLLQLLARYVGEKENGGGERRGEEKRRGGGEEGRGIWTRLRAGSSPVMRMPGDSAGTKRVRRRRRRGESRAEQRPGSEERSKAGGGEPEGRRRECGEERRGEERGGEERGGEERRGEERRGEERRGEERGGDLLHSASSGGSDGEERGGGEEEEVEEEEGGEVVVVVGREGSGGNRCEREEEGGGTDCSTGWRSKEQGA